MNDGGAPDGHRPAVETSPPSKTSTVPSKTSRGRTGPCRSRTARRSLSPRRDAGSGAGRDARADAGPTAGPRSAWCPRRPGRLGLAEGDPDDRRHRAVLSFVIKTFFFRAFYIPSGSMEPTLEINDRIFVNLLVPGPFELERGDVVVFKDTKGWLGETAPVEVNPASGFLAFVGLLPDSSQQHLVKRVIGLPGDTVECCDADGRILRTANRSPNPTSGRAPRPPTRSSPSRFRRTSCGSWVTTATPPPTPGTTRTSTAGSLTSGMSRAKPP